MKYFYLVMAFLGTLLPWLFFGSFFASNGIDIIGFVKSLFASNPSAGFSVDILLSIFVFWVWSYIDAHRLNIKSWWLVLPSSFFVGLSFALPLYLFLRESKKDSQSM